MKNNNWEIRQLQMLIEDIKKFEKTIETRALDLLNVQLENKITKKLLLKKIEYYTDYIHVEFIEDRFTDCPDEWCESITLNQLAMTEEDWQAHLNEIALKLQMKNIELEKKYLQSRKAEKLKLFNELKKELGL